MGGLTRRNSKERNVGANFLEALGLLTYGGIPAMLSVVGFWHINEMYNASTKASDFAFSEWIFWWIGRFVGYVVLVGGILVVLSYAAVQSWDTYRDGVIVWIEVILGTLILISLIPEYLDIRRYYRDDEIMGP